MYDINGECMREPTTYLLYLNDGVLSSTTNYIQSRKIK